MQAKIRHTLSVRLFLLLFAVMTLGFCAYAYHSIQKHTSYLMQTVYLSADRAADIIKRSTRYAMLLNRKEDLYHIINTIGNEPGVDGIRIYNKKGDIITSTNDKEVGKTVDMRAEACIACHSEEQPLEALTIKERRRVYKVQAGHRVLGLINPIDNEPECYNAACHAHDKEQKVLGVLDVKMSLATVDSQLKRSRKEMMVFGGLLILGVAVVSGQFIYFFVRKRIYKLIIGTREIAAGNLSHRIDVKGQDEIGHLANSFNKMTTELVKAREEITNWSSSLEDKVMRKSAELEKAQSHIIRMEKLASLGKLSATVAHEINNPLTGVLNYTFLVLRILKKNELTEQNQKDLFQYLEFIKNEVYRCSEIVKNMLIFARQTGGNFSREYIHNLVESSLMLVNHKLELKNIKLVKSFKCDQDYVDCDAGQVRQALVALFVNAIEAMDENDQLTVRICCEENQTVRLEIEDTGYGIPDDILPNIFDPFFSTKKDGHGVGLGLAVVYGIIQRHKGDIQVKSEVNRGTVFIITLPRKPIPDSVDITDQTITEM